MSEELVRTRFPEAICVLECSTDENSDWPGPALYDYKIYADRNQIRDLSGFWPYPARAWEKAWEAIQ